MSEEKDALPGDDSGNRKIARPSAAGKRPGRTTGKTATPRKTAPGKSMAEPDPQTDTPEPAAKSKSTTKKTASAAKTGAAAAKSPTTKTPPVKKTSDDPAAATSPETSPGQPAKPASRKTRKSVAVTEAAPASVGESAVAEQLPTESAPAPTSGSRAKKSAGRKTSAKKAAPPQEAASPAPEQPTPDIAPGQSDTPVDSHQTAEVQEEAPAAKKTAARATAAKRSRSRSKTASVTAEETPPAESALPQDKETASIAEMQTPDPAGHEPQELPPDVPAEGDAATAPQGEKKRRSRSRRGRGRKKAAAAANADAAGTALADPAAEEGGEAAATEASDSADTGREPIAKPGGDTGETEPRPTAARRKMFVSVQPAEQVEVVLTEEGQVQEYYVEMLHQAKTKGNIYKAVIHNVDPNLQAAFVSYGAVKNGFLQIDEVHPEYYVTLHDPGKGRKYPPIQKVLKAGQEVLVQVVKEPAGTKGAFLTTYLSLPGRFLVLTPGREQIGVSRKVEQEEERSRLRELLEGLNPGPGLGVIVRTVSMGASKTNLQRDLQNLKKLWKEVRARGTSEKAPSLIYQEMDLTTRAVRDYLTEQVAEVWLDDEQTAKDVAELAEILFPRKKNLVRTHTDAGTTLFERFNLQRQLDQIHSREVSLPSGGRLVFDITEALTAIDINSGRSGGKNNFEDMAYRTNMEAARMIPLQLRLRDIGGQIVADFIEMRDRNHWRDVEKTLRAGMKTDRARYDVGKIGPFGLLEIVRQRLGSSAISVSTEPCPHCKGTGVRRNMEWQSQQALRELQRQMRAVQGQENASVVYETEPLLALHLLNNKRQRLVEMEQNFGVNLEIHPKFAGASDG